MADPHHHHHDPIQDNIDAHPVKLAIGIVIGAIALIVGIYLLVQLAVHGYAGRDMKGNPAMSDAAVKQRLGPVAKVEVDPNAPATPAAAPAAAPAVAAVSVPPAAAPGKAAAAGAADGKATYTTVCAVCHGAGVAGAPKFADKAAWAPRIAQGVNVLHANAMKGKGAMPPKGGNPSLSDAQVAAAVDYMVGAAK